MQELVFGMPILIEAPGLKESMVLCKELGLRFIEISMNLPLYQTDRIPVDAYKEMLTQNNIFLTIHLPENLHICDYNQTVASAYLDTVVDAIVLAKRLSVPLINMHLSDGILYTLPEGKIHLFEQYQDNYLEKLLLFRKRCEEAVGGADITICIENCGPFLNFQKAGIQLLLESSVFGLTYDIGHDYTANNANEAFILEYGSRLKHMHIHDATRTQNHMVLGAGEIDITDKLSIAQRHHCRCVLETKTSAALRQSVEYLKRMGMI